jgi:guanine deaminase
MNTTLVFQGAIIHSLDSAILEILDEATLIVTNGRIVGFFKSNVEIPPHAIPPNAKIHIIPPNDFLIPGFVDVHNHAPQW